jgi:hypothetical protein
VVFRSRRSRQSPRRLLCFLLGWHQKALEQAIWGACSNSAGLLQFFHLMCLNRLISHKSARSDFREFEDDHTWDARSLI